MLLQQMHFGGICDLTQACFGAETSELGSVPPTLRILTPGRNLNSYFAEIR
jgi:hypothetical protein